MLMEGRQQKLLCTYMETLETTYQSFQITINSIIPCVCVFMNMFEYVFVKWGCVFYFTF